MGMKRKLEEFDPNETKPGGQRQSILDISVGKLHSKTLKKVEPPLLKSVLILNTLKHIETELLKEGSQLSNNSSFAFPKVDLKSDIIDVLPADPCNMETDFMSSPNQCGPLPSIDTFVGTKVVPVDLKPKEEMDNPDRGSESNLATLFPASFRIEEMLAEFDLPIPDVDSVASFTFNGMKLPALSADDIVHSFPNSSASENFTTLLGGGVSPYCKGESALPMEDLDNIMQILVGS